MSSDPVWQKSGAARSATASSVFKHRALLSRLAIASLGLSIIVTSAAAANVDRSPNPDVPLRMAASVTGVVTDAQSGDPLPGAAVRVQGTSIGAATDLQGRYHISNVPVGTQTLVASYVGYQSVEMTLSIEDGGSIQQDFVLSPRLVEGDEVVITAQLEGQARAINRQLTAERLVNVVSSERIRELPDANVAESLGRLPGVSIQRNAGEGQKVNIRGLSPRFTNITINGQKIPATDNDRSVDLSMISQEALGGIEVYKAITPDQDADATAGSVNFELRQAPVGFQGRADVQGGFNTLSSEFGDFKASGSASSRFANNRLGILVTGTAQRADRGRDQFDVDYRPLGIDEDTGELLLEVIALTLVDQLETRDRYTASIALDYDASINHRFKGASFFSQTNRDILARFKEYAPSFGQVQHRLGDTERRLILWNNMLSGEHLLGFVDAEWMLGHSSTTDDVPFSTGLTFEEGAPFTPDLITDRGPFPLPDFAKNNLDETFLLGGGNKGESRAENRDLTARLDLEIPFSTGAQMSGYFKFGGKHTDALRTFRAMQFNRQNSTSFLLRRDNPGELQLFNGNPTVVNFSDPEFDPGDFMDGRFDFNVNIRENAAREIFERYADSLALPTRFATLDDYDAGEQITAGYGMTRIDLGSRIMFIGGLRYERNKNDYAARFTDDIGGQFGQQGSVIDTTAERSYGEWLPMAQARISLTEYLQMRLAVTRTLARPVFTSLSPGGRIDFAGFRASIDRGNPDLAATTSWNYDASFSLFNSRFGLFSIGGFYKRLQDIDYIASLVINDPESRFFGFDLRTPRNAEGLTEAYGLETELQTNLRWLPSPFNGVVLYANYTRTWGETVFPFLEVITGPPPFFRQEFVDSEREGPLPGQSNHIVNGTLGYEKGGFSGRVSLIYQSVFLDEVGLTPERDSFFDDFVRIDLTLNQRIYKNLTVYLLGTNVSGLTERSLQGGRSIFIEDEEDYGSTWSLGLRYVFD